MKRLGKAVILTFAEYESLMCRTEDAEAHAADFAEELSRMRANGVLAEARRRQERNDLESQVTTLDRLLSELPDSSVIDRMSLESRKKEVQDELAGKVTG
jgi:hypothetical protein